MNILELDTYRLSDAVKFNDTLNPKLWGSDERLLPEVHEKLMAIAEDFREFLGIDVEVKDITISGSNAAYTYTPHSDIDLHLVVDLPRADESDVYRELFDAKKYAYNDQHDFKIGGYDVELYVQDANKPHHSQGIYSIQDDKWLSVPKRRKPEINDISVKSKYEDLGHRIEAAIESGSLEQMDAMAEKIRNFRQAGLDAHGEFGPENLAFKILRSNGTLEKLRNARREAKDNLMSLDERRKKKKKKSKKKFKYGAFGGYYFPGYGYYGDTGSAEAADGGGDGGGGESVRESQEPIGVEEMLQKFVAFAAEQIGIESMPRIRFRRDPAWSERNSTFGRYVPEENILYVSMADRHPMDIMRTVAHELTHHRQDEIAPMPDGCGDTGSAWENEANAAAGIIMRRFSELHPDLFQGQSMDESIRGRLGAAAAAACIAGTPGCATTDAVKAAQTVQTIGRAAQNIPTRAGAEEELRTAIKDVLRKGTGTRESAEDKPDINDPIINYDVPYTAIARPERLWQVRRFGRVSHYDRAGHPMAIVSVPISKEKAFVDNMRNQGVQVQRSKVYEASGYIPTEAEKDDPRFSMALTVDVHPGQTGKEANKLGLKTDSQGRPALLMKKLGNLLESVKTGLDVPTHSPETLAKKHDVSVDVIKQQLKKGIEVELEHTTSRELAREIALDHLAEFPDYYDRLESVERVDERQLFEVKMSPGELQKWAQSPEAEGIQAGFEAELIFRDTARDDNEESEPDYDADERAYSVQQVRDFFTGGEYGITSRTADRLEAQLYDEFYNWQNEAVDNEWDGEEERQVRDWIVNNISEDEYRERAAADLGIETAEEQAERADEISERVQELIDADVEEAIDSRNDTWQSAYDDFADNFRDGMDEEAFFRDEYRYMSDVQNAFELDWPYWTEGSYSDGRSVDDIANSLSSALGDAKVRGSTGYHSVQRRPGLWIIEPDGSLDPDEYEDAGLEVVSPPMPLPQALEALRKVIDWANDSNEGNAYTNGSTGLHMGVSIPYKGGEVDYVKLILFLGDQYVLEKFGRAANSYTRSALSKLKQVQQRRRGTKEDVTDRMTGSEKTAAAMELMKKNLIELAQQYVQDGVGRDKYTSAHIKDGYIEFRSPGGDYLSIDSDDESALSNTMLRFARSMYIAGRPDVERKEYSKKLYKLLSGFKSAEISKPASDTKYKTRIETEGDNDALELFARYSTGQITPEELKKEWAQQVLAKEQSAKTEQEYEIYNKDTGETLETLKFERGKDSEGMASMTIANAVEKYAEKGIPIGLRQIGEPAMEPSRRAKVAKRIQTKKQSADAAQDSEDLENRLRGTEQRYLVQWTELRNGREVSDSLGVTARNATAAMDQVRSALESQGRRPTTIQADQAPIPGSTLDRAQQRAQQATAGARREYQIYDRTTGHALIGFMAAGDEEALERLRRYRLEQQPEIDVGVRTGGESMRTQTTPQGEWTGGWLIKDAQGQVLHRFHGIGNVQADANRHAAQWLGTNRPDLVGQDVEVVPEMQ